MQYAFTFFMVLFAVSASAQDASPDASMDAFVTLEDATSSDVGSSNNYIWASGSGGASCMVSKGTNEPHSLLLLVGGIAWLRLRRNP